MSKKMASDYRQQLQDLLNGKIDELTVQANDFMAFRKAWQVLPQRKEISGTAKRNGTIIYRRHVSGNVQP